MVRLTTSFWRKIFVLVVTGVLLVIFYFVYFYVASTQFTPNLLVTILLFVLSLVLLTFPVLFVPQTSKRTAERPMPAREERVGRPLVRNCPRCGLLLPGGVLKCPNCRTLSPYRIGKVNGTATTSKSSKNTDFEKLKQEFLDNA